MAEVFTIGVTLLESATLVDCDRLYNRGTTYSFLRDTLEQIRQELVGKYSEPLVNYILRMTEFSPSNRPRASKIYSELQPYENEILNLEEFQFPRPQQSRPSQGYSNYSPSSHYAQQHAPYSYQPSVYQPEAYNANIRPDTNAYYNMLRPIQSQVPPISQVSTSYQSRPY